MKAGPGVEAYSGARLIRCVVTLAGGPDITKQYPLDRHAARADLHHAHGAGAIIVRHGLAKPQVCTPLHARALAGVALLGDVHRPRR